MAATKTTSLDPAFAVAVAKVQPALAAWRSGRKPREPIPETLWQDLVRMARAYRPSPVAQALRVNYSALKRRVLTNPPASPARTGDPVRL
ncbi:MAG: hypothetical protein ABSA47_09405 [Verrucomicrobiota bacterium]|jgi:hypothetical protein